MAKIETIKAREILDSRGNPTVEAEIKISDNFWGRAAVPSGSSTGRYEAFELRDGESRYGGLGATKAVANVNNLIAPELLGRDWDQASLDNFLIALDNTPNKNRLGANAILAVSLAFAQAAARADKIPLFRYFQKISGSTGNFLLPVPLILIIEGGKHADGGLDFQEFMIVPHGAPNFKEALRWGTEIYHATAKILKQERYGVNVGFEGAYGPQLANNEMAVEIILRGIEAAGYTPRQDISLALDMAASEFFTDNKYLLAAEKRELSVSQMIEFYSNWSKKYPLVSLEDGLAEDDWEGWQNLTRELGEKTQLVGDDLFVTNPKRLQLGIEKKAANAILIKPNQIGTMTETIATIKLAKENNYRVIVSHRSGETEDAIIADLAVGLGVGQIKTGAPCRGERVAKYNQLLRIEEELADQATFSWPN